MKKIKEWMEDIFVHAGVGKEEYRNVREAIRDRNRGMLLYSTAIAGALLTMLFVLSYISPTIAGNRLLYGNVLIWVLVSFLLERLVIRKYTQLTMFACYVFVLLVYSFAIALGTVMQPEFPATTFCVLLFAVPLLFTDQPYRLNLILTIVAVSFCYVSFHTKEFEVANLDEVNALCFLILGVVVNTYMQRMKIRELVQRSHIEHQRDTDELTKLMTRPAAEAKIRDYMKKTKDPAALLVLDIDDFKGINDTWGHAYGDAVLRIMGQCIQNTFQDMGISGRYGGDEFLVFLPQTEGREQVVEKIKNLSKLMKENIEVPEKSRQIHGSIGIACYPRDAKDYHELFTKADEALYQSKAKGKDCYTFYFDRELLERR